jgi:hypothetical protein
MPKGDGRGEADIERANAIKELIKDCLAFQFNEKESIQFISGRLGLKYTRGKHKGKDQKIGPVTFYKYKKQVVDEMVDVDKRMFEHAKVGFVLKHFELMDKSERIYQNLASTFFTTTNPMAKASLAQQALNHADFLKQLNLGTPIIEQMRQYVAENLKSNQGTNNDTIVNSPDLPNSALVLPKGFIKSSVESTNDSGGVSTGKEPVDRVFEKSRKTERKAILDQGSEGT